jgi:glycosyltransferase involved in cell wall biosynthesis
VYRSEKHDIDYSSLRIAIVHEWLLNYSGAERITEQLLNLFPHADLFALVEFLPENLRHFIRNKKVNTSFIQKLPGAKRHYRSYLPLMPLAVEQFDLSGYDLIISNNYAVSKGVITGPDQLHISCVCSPMRYAWDLTHQYLDESGLKTSLKGWLAKWILHKIRMWDFRTANGVDKFVAISDFISRRIWKVYRRKAEVIYPPVNVNGFTLRNIKEDFYLTVSRMVPYKKINLIVNSFTRMPDKKLIVVGDGPDFDKIKQTAGANINMLGYLPFDGVKYYMQRAKAFVFAAEEDFGIVPLEAQACGTPVIAYGKGGSLETVIENVTGIFFDKQNEESLIGAVKRFETIKDSFDPEDARANALRFSEENFRTKFKQFVDSSINERLSKTDKSSVKKLILRGKSNETSSVTVPKREFVLK